MSKKRIFLTLLAAVVYNIWVERNRRLFAPKQEAPDTIVNRLKVEIQLHLKGRKGPLGLG